MFCILRRRGHQREIYGEGQRTKIIRVLYTKEPYRSYDTDSVRITLAHLNRPHSYGVMDGPVYSTSSSQIDPPKSKFICAMDEQSVFASTEKSCALFDVTLKWLILCHLVWNFQVVKLVDRPTLHANHGESKVPACAALSSSRIQFDYRQLHPVDMDSNIVMRPVRRRYQGEQPSEPTEIISFPLC